MTRQQEDCFVVFERDNRREIQRALRPRERELAICATYEEALEVSRQRRRPDHRCVIRFVGAAGGGD